MKMPQAFSLEIVKRGSWEHPWTLSFLHRHNHENRETMSFQKAMTPVSPLSLGVEPEKDQYTYFLGV
jgi:hypothetical protein